MPGIPRSTACQNCKNRRTKCDQNWPTCSSCKRRGYRCPGPSTLLKFVAHEGGNAGRAAHKDATREPATAGVPVAAGHKNVTNKHNQSGFTRFHIPQPCGPPTTAADRVGLRLVKNMEGDPSLDTKRYYDYLPSRLAESVCLRDCVTLYCSTVSDYRLQKSAGASMTMACYGKALRSLRRTVQSPQAADLETLVSVTLLGRSEDFFDPAWKQFQTVHSQAVVHLAESLGPPDGTDRYHFGVFLDTYETMVLHFLMTGRKSLLMHPQWRHTEVLAATKMLEPELQPVGLASVKVGNPLFAKAGRFLRTIHNIRTDPTTVENAQLAAEILAELPVREAAVTETYHNLIEKALELGRISETEEPMAPSGKAYKSRTDFLGRILLHAMMLRAAMTRIRYDLSVLYNIPGADTLFSNYRRVCSEMCMFVPTILGVDRLIGIKAIIPLTLSFEGAEDVERAYVIDSLLEQTHYRMRLPRDRKELASTLITQAKLLTGRLPLG